MKNTELKKLYDKNTLNITNIKKLICKQRICWITHEENSALDKKYKRHRLSPDKAYKEVGIKIYK
jgi:ABC-type iron transport system FetAB ATPase subunit